MTLKSIGQTGDTIIEVLIVLAIIGFAITITYSSAGRSLGDARQSQENSYAAEIAQNQIEQLRTAVISSSPDPTGRISNLTTPNAPIDVGILNGTGPKFCMISGKVTLPTASPSPCDQQNGAAGATYTITDTLNQSDSNPVAAGLPKINVFTVLVTWPDTLGQGQDTVTLLYRAYPPPAALPTGVSPNHVSWFVNGGFSGGAVPVTCNPFGACPIGPNPSPITGLSSRLLSSVGATVTYDYTSQVSPPIAPNVVPVPGDVGLTLKLCYNNKNTGAVKVLVGGVVASNSITLTANSNSDSSCGGVAPNDYETFQTIHNINLPATTPLNTTIQVQLLSGTVELFDATLN